MPAGHGGERGPLREVYAVTEPRPILFGWPQNAAGDEWCATNPRTDTTMLCGRKISSVPEVQPDGKPAHLCPTCRALLVTEAGPVGRPQESGVYPSCGGDAPVAGGVVQAHRRWVVTLAGTVQTQKPCDGAGQPPDAAP